MPAAAWGLADIQHYWHSWQARAPLVGAVCPPWLPSSFCTSRVSTLSTLASHAPIYTQIHSPLLPHAGCPLGGNVCRDQQALSPAAAGPLCLIPLAHSSPRCAGRRSVGPRGGSTAQQIPECPRPLAHLRSILWDMRQQPQTHYRHWATSTGATVRISPFPRLFQCSLTPHTLTASHILTHTIYNSHANFCSHTHSNTHS